MPTVTLSDATFAELKSLAEPFVDTPESLVAALIHDEVERRGALVGENGKVAGSKDNVLQLDPQSHDDLGHTRLISATVNNRELPRPKWNSLMNHLHVLARKRLGSLDAIRRVSGANLKQAKYEKDGYKYEPDGDFSIQGVGANAAWDNSLSVAQALKLGIKVKFEWRDKDGAAHPGETGVLEWTPTEA